jgi:hypothetical protein
VLIILVERSWQKMTVFSVISLGYVSRDKCPSSPHTQSNKPHHDKPKHCSQASRQFCSFGSSTKTKQTRFGQMPKCCVVRTLVYSDICLIRMQTEMGPKIGLCPIPLRTERVKFSPRSDPFWVHKWLAGSEV